MSIQLRPLNVQILNQPSLDGICSVSAIDWLSVGCELVGERCPQQHPEDRRGPCVVS